MAGTWRNSRKASKRRCSIDPADQGSCVVQPSTLTMNGPDHKTRLLAFCRKLGGQAFAPLSPSSDNLGCVCGLIDFLCSLGLKGLQAVALQAIKAPVPLPPLIGRTNVLDRELHLLRIGML